MFVPSSSVNAYSTAPGWNLFTDISAIANVLASGTCGANLTWKLTDGYKLIIEGSGSMNDYSLNSSPWSDYQSLIKQVEIAEGVKSVGSCSFMQCSSLVAINLPRSVTTIGSQAFSNCVNITSVSCKAIEPPVFIGSNGLSDEYGVWYGVPLKECILFVPQGTVEFYKTAEIWKEFGKIQAEAGDSEGGHDFEVDGIYYNIVSATDLTCEVTFKGDTYDEYSDEYVGAVVVPTTITYKNKTFAVSGVDENAFRGCGNLTKVVLPNSVTSIGKRAFENCASLSDISLPNQLTCIEEGTFYGCTSLKTISIPGSVERICGFAFDGCNLTDIVIEDAVNALRLEYGYWFDEMVALPMSVSPTFSCSNIKNIYIGRNLSFDAEVSLASYPMPYIMIPFDGLRGANTTTSVVIGDKVTDIPDYLFYELNVDFDIPSGVKTIGHYAFYRNKALVELELPSSVLSVGNNAYAECSKLESVLIPNSVTSIGNEAFTQCPNLEEVIINGNKLNVGSSAFASCAKLTSLTISNGVSSIGERAFYNCSALQTAVIGDGVSTIGNESFKDCFNLSEIVFGAGVTSIGQSVVDGCNSLKTITCSAVTPPTISEDTFYAALYLWGSLFVPSSSVNAYSTASGWKLFAEISAITNGPTIVASGTCGDNLTWKLYKDGELVIEGTGVMDSYFLADEVPWCSYRTSIKTVSIKDGVTSIGDGAFIGCSNLERVVISASCVDIDESAFNLCRNLRVIRIDEGNIVYADCEQNAIVTKGTGTLLIGTTSGYIPEGCKHLGDFAFAGRNVDTVVVPNGVISIGTYTFAGCSLKSIKIPSSLESCGDWAFDDSFYRCENLSAVYLEDLDAWFKIDFKYIYSAPLYQAHNLYLNNERLEIVSIPEGLTTLKGYVLAGWNGKEVIMPRSLVEISENAFFGCSSLTSITCKAMTPPAINEYTFSNLNKSIPLYVPAVSVEVYKSAQFWREFINILPIEESIEKNITLVDGADFEKEGTEGIYNITYTRNFRNTSWQALYVPFEIPLNEDLLVDFEVADINDIRQYDHDNDGVKDDAVIEAFKVKNGTLKANYPYLIRAKEVGEKSIVVTDAILYAAEENSIDCSSVHEKYTFTGTYRRMSSVELPQSGGYYALSGGVWQPVAEGASLGAFRFYLKVEDRHANTAITNARSIRVRVVDENGEEDDVTEISNSQLMMDDSKLIIYDLQGRRITDTANLKGVYIVNGKKVVY